MMLQLLYSKMIYPTYVVFVCLWTFRLSTASHSYHGSSSGADLFLNKYPIPVKNTNSPININTKNVICGEYSSLILQANVNDRMILRNTGNSFWAYDDTPSYKSIATQSVLGDCVYQFSSIRFLWTREKNGRCGISIDGKGYPLQAVVYFYKRIYGSFNRALHYRDGLAAVMYPISIGCEPNKYFEPFAEKMEKIRKSGTSTSTTLGTTIKWYTKTPNNSTLYSHPGGYVDDCSGKTYYCETVIILANNTASLSQEQFDRTFASLKNCEDQSYNSTKQLYCSNVPVIESKGVILKETKSCNGKFRS